MYGSRGSPCQSPELSGTLMTERGAVAACEHRRDPLALLRQPQLPHGIDAGIHLPQPSTREPITDCRLREAERQQLDSRDHPLLLAGKVPRCSLVSFCRHSDQKAPMNVDSPPTSLSLG